MRRIVVLAAISSWAGAASAQAPWGDYAYSRPIVVTHASELRDWPVELELDTAALIAAGKMRADCADVRVRQGVLPCNYFLESGCDSSRTVVWVRCPLVGPTPGSHLVLYGNPDAVSESAPARVFPVWDDFSTDPGQRWPSVHRFNGDAGNEFSWSGSSLYLTRAVADRAGGGVVGSIAPEWERGFSIRFRYRVSGGDGADGLALGFFHEGNSNMGGALSLRSNGYALELDNYQSPSDATANHIAIVRTSPAGGYPHLASYDTAATEDGQWHAVELRFLEDEVRVALDDVEVLQYAEAFDKTYRFIDFGAGTGLFYLDHEIDDVVVRPLLSPEPAATLGEERELGPAAFTIGCGCTSGAATDGFPLAALALLMARVRRGARPPA